MTVKLEYLSEEKEEFDSVESIQSENFAVVSFRKGEILNIFTFLVC